MKADPHCHCYENSFGFIGDCPVHDVRTEGGKAFWPAFWIAVAFGIVGSVAFIAGDYHGWHSAVRQLFIHR